MREAGFTVRELLGRLEKVYGQQRPSWPADPYEFIVWWNCGYPPSDVACEKGWRRLQSEVGTDPLSILGATSRKIASAVRVGGLIPESRASRLKETAMRVKEEFGGDLRVALTGSLSGARKILKKFPGIADPGADRILLFAGIMPIAAVPSNCTHVLVRILYGQESKSYGVNYRRAQQAISEGVPETFEARTQAYLLLKHHGQEVCKRSKPRCEHCPVNFTCAFFGAGAATAR
jgi:endonuclease III